MLFLVLLAFLVFEMIEVALLRGTLRDHLHKSLYPFPSYQRSLYYRKLEVPQGGEMVHVYNHFGFLKKAKPFSTSTDMGSPFLNLVAHTLQNQKALRLMKCWKKGKLFLLVYTENMQSPTHLFPLGEEDIDEDVLQSQNLQQELLSINKLIQKEHKNFDENNTLNEIGFALGLASLGNQLGYLTWAKQGDYIVGWYQISPVFVLRVGEDVKQMLKEYYSENPVLSNMISDRWEDSVFISVIENKDMYILTKYRTPRNNFKITFDVFLDSWFASVKKKLGHKEITTLKNFINNMTVEDLFYGSKYGDFKEMIRGSEDKGFKAIFFEFLDNLKSFETDGTVFELSSTRQ